MLPPLSKVGSGQQTFVYWSFTQPPDAMFDGIKKALRSPKTRLNILLGIGLLLLIWVLFFDSHSIRNRWYWERESQRMTTENLQLQQDIEAAKRRIKSADTTFVIEERAREDFMMRRSGETVYRVEKKTE